jgi:hypothetical protein
MGSYLSTPVPATPNKPVTEVITESVQPTVNTVETVKPVVKSLDEPEVKSLEPAKSDVKITEPLAEITSEPVTELQAALNIESKPPSVPKPETPPELQEVVQSVIETPVKEAPKTVEIAPVDVSPSNDVVKKNNKKKKGKKVTDN